MLGAISNPQIADIAGALDIRQKKLDADEAKRKEIRTAELIKQAIPGLREGSPLRELAGTDIQKFAFLAKTMGVPLNSGEQMQEQADDAHAIARIAESDPEGAIQYAEALRQKRADMGLDTSRLDSLMQIAKQDPGKAIRAVQVLDKSLNADLYRKRDIENREMAQKDRALDIQEKRIGMDGAQLTQGTSDQKNWSEYQRLLKTDPAAAEQFGRASGFVSSEGQKLSAFAEKEIAGASDEYTAAIGAVGRYRTLADKLRQSSLSGGLKGTWGEYLKEQTGNQDELTALRKEALSISNSEAINNLPPGPATDRDIEIAKAPFPTEKSSPEYVANWLGAISRLNEKKAEYAEFKANFIGKHGSVRSKDGQTIAAAWKDLQKSKMGGSGEGSMTPGITPTIPSGAASKYKIEVMD